MDDERHKRFIATADAFNLLVEVVHRLRAPGGCPWDRKQTPKSLKQYVIEEAYEVIDAIDAGETEALKEELGDLILQVVLQAEIAKETGRFAIEDVLQSISRKLVHRHPHVFGETQVSGAEEVISNWEKLKQKEKKDRGLLDRLPRHLPALQMAGRIGEKARRVGFDWPNAKSVREKVTEELLEADEAAAGGDQEAITHEIGDLLFAVAQWARHLGVQPEEALRHCAARFKDRFRTMEKSAKKSGKMLEEMPIETLEGLWQEAKKR